MKRLLLALVLLLPSIAMAGSLQPLTATEAPALLKPPARGERIIALWALDCAYCEPNLEALAAVQRAHPHEIELLTVTTDSIGQRVAIEARILLANKSNNFGEIQVWHGAYQNELAHAR